MTCIRSSKQPFSIPLFLFLSSILHKLFKLCTRCSLLFKVFSFLCRRKINCFSLISSIDFPFCLKLPRSLHDPSKVFSSSCHCAISPLFPSMRHWTLSVFRDATILKHHVQKETSVTHLYLTKQ